MWWMTTTPPNGPCPRGCARYASIWSPPWPAMVIVSAFMSWLMEARLPSAEGCGHRDRTILARQPPGQVEPELGQAVDGVGAGYAAGGGVSVVVVGPVVVVVPPQGPGPFGPPGAQALRLAWTWVKSMTV